MIKKQIVASESNLDESIQEFLDQVGNNEGTSAEDKMTVMNVIKHFLEQDGRFQWGNVVIVKEKK